MGADFGSHGYATPVVAKGKVLIGANNATQYYERHEGDRGTRGRGRSPTR